MGHSSFTNLCIIVLLTSKHECWQYHLLVRNVSFSVCLVSDRQGSAMYSMKRGHIDCGLAPGPPESRFLLSFCFQTFGIMLSANF